MSESSGLVVALIAARSEFCPVKKTSDNPFFKSKFADLEAVMAACEPALSKHGLAVIQLPQISSEGACLETRLEHIGGDARISRYPLNPTKQNDPQALGACVTYARRYAYKAVLGLVEEDDDGNAAGNRGPNLAPMTASGYMTWTESAGYLAKKLEDDERERRGASRPKASPPSAPSAAPSAPPVVSDTRDDDIAALVKKMGWAQPHAENFLKKTFGVTTRARLTPAQKDECIVLLQARAAAETAFPGAK